MKLSDLHPVWRETLACHEALRRLGFVSDDLFVSRHEDGRLKVIVKSIRYALVVNTPEGDPGELRGRTTSDLANDWSRAATLWNSATPDEMLALWQSSLIARQGMRLVIDLKMHGIELPATADA